MRLIEALAAVALVLFLLWDAFETILLPRRVPSRLRISRWVSAGLWRAWAAVGRGFPPGGAREATLSFYPLLSILLLLVVWAAGLIAGFAVLHDAAGRHVAAEHGVISTGTLFYLSGSSFLTLGLGDVAPIAPLERFLVVVEAGMGFGFLALLLAYIPVLYQSFSRREARITMLDEWAASPPSAAVLLRRAGESRDPDTVAGVLRAWEINAAEMLESHISYPVLAFFRSQHDNQSWVASLTTILDTCALVIVGVERIDPFQARLTFAMARHAVVDLSQTFYLRPEAPPQDRLPPESLQQLRKWLADAGVPLAAGDDVPRRLADLRGMYEPYVHVLSRHLMMPLPGWLPPERVRFNWRTTAWGRTGKPDAH